MKQHREFLGGHLCGKNSSLFLSYCLFFEGHISCWQADFPSKKKKKTLCEYGYRQTMWKELVCHYANIESVQFQSEVVYQALKHKKLYI